MGGFLWFDTTTTSAVYTPKPTTNRVLLRLIARNFLSNKPPGWVTDFPSAPDARSSIRRCVCVWCVYLATPATAAPRVSRYLPPTTSTTARRAATTRAADQSFSPRSRLPRARATSRDGVDRRAPAAEDCALARPVLCAPLPDRSVRTAAASEPPRRKLAHLSLSSLVSLVQRRPAADAAARPAGSSRAPRRRA